MFDTCFQKQKIYQTYFTAVDSYMHKHMDDNETKENT